MIFRFAYPWVLFIGFPLLALIAWWRWKYYKGPRYLFSLTDLLKSKIAQNSNSFFIRRLFFINRCILLVLLLLATARPQLGEMNSKVPTHGIAIMLVLDGSNSMLLLDDPRDQKNRFDIAVEEAERFIDKRLADEIGLVLFANTAVSRCPLTFDKKLLKKIVHDTHIGVLDPEGTKLSTAIALAAQRLKSSKAKSKIMVVLTDGEPTPYDIAPDIALDYARKYDVKIYAIGIGGEQAYMQHPMFHALIPCSTVYNKALLQTFARETGGKFFEAKKAQELQKIYTAIDQLEKTEYEVPFYESFYELYGYCLMLFLILFSAELLFKTRRWMRL